MQTLSATQQKYCDAMTNNSPARCCKSSECLPVAASAAALFQIAGGCAVG